MSKAIIKEDPKIRSYGLIGKKNSYTDREKPAKQCQEFIGNRYGTGIYLLVGEI
jgi:hypothetical protein